MLTYSTPQQHSAGCPQNRSSVESVRTITHDYPPRAEQEFSMVHPLANIAALGCTIRAVRLGVDDLGNKAPSPNIRIWASASRMCSVSKLTASSAFFSSTVSVRR